MGQHLLEDGFRRHPGRQFDPQVQAAARQGEPRAGRKAARHGLRHPFALVAQLLAQAAQMALESAGAHEIGHGNLRQHLVGPREAELEHLHARLPLAGGDPAQPHARRQHLVERGAVDHVARCIPRLGRRERRLALIGGSAAVVLDQRDAARLAPRHQALLVRVGHDAAERILQVGHHGHGLDVVVGLRGQFQRLQRDAGLRAARDFERAHAQALENLQQTVIRGRFHGDDIARLGHGAQGKVQRLGAAMGDDHVLGRELDARAQRVPGQCGAQGRMAVCLGRAAKEIGIAPQRAGRGGAQRGRGVERGRAARAAEVDLDIAMLAAREDGRDALVNAHVLRWVGQAGRRFLDRRQRRARRRAHEVARARPCFQQPGGFQFPARLERRGQAHLMQPHQRPHRRHAVPHGQCAGGDGLPVVAGHLLIEREGGVRGSHGAIIAHGARAQQIQMKGVCIVTEPHRAICSGPVRNPLCLLAWRAAR
ncbi:hypothetical protein D3C72_958780 [compost metagenome]